MAGMGFGGEGVDVWVADVPVAFGLGLAVLLVGLLGLDSGMIWMGADLGLAIPCPSLRGFRAVSLSCHRLP